MQTLEETQREFFRALLLPLRGSSRRATDLRPNDEPHSKEFFKIADHIIRPGPALSSAERLELYHRQYWYRILDSLAEDFPTVRKMAGESLFWNLLETYLLDRPSRSHTLRHLGEEFAERLRHSTELDDTQRIWFSSIAEIEYAFMEVFEAAQTQRPEPQDLALETIELQAHVRLISLSVPADLCWSWDDFSPASQTPRESLTLAVWREQSGSSSQTRVDAHEALLLTAMKPGILLADLFSAFSELPLASEDITRWFAQWQARGWLGIKGKSYQEEVDLTAGWKGMDRMSSQTLAME